MAAAAVLALSVFGGVAQAATITLNDGDTINPINVADVYIFEDVLPQGTTGGAGSVSFTFVANASQLPLSLLSATANLKFNGATISGLTLSLFDGVNTVFAPLTVAGSAVFGEFINSFSNPDGLTQTLTLGWTGYDTRRGTIQLSVAVAAVPLPAGGLLLIGAIGGLAALRRRKAMAA